VTFVGYLVDDHAGGTGLPGAAVATVAVVLPGLCLVALLNPWIARLRSWPWAGRFLDAVSAASIGLTAVVAIRLAQDILLVRTPEGVLLPEWRGCMVALAAGAVLWRWKLAPAWLVLAGALAGLVLWSIPA
jgi:chromate transporter